MPVRPETFKPGLILVRKILGLSVGLHYGVWVAPDEVVHASKTERIVVCNTFDEFAAGLDVHVSDYSELNTEDPERIVERARMEIGKWPYDLLDGNCEIFVLWCTTGTKSPGLQMGLVKLLVGLADTFVLAPLRVEKQREDTKRAFVRYVGKTLLVNLTEIEQTHAECKATLEKLQDWDAEAVIGSERIEQAMDLHHECQTVVRRAYERRDQRSKRQNEVIRQVQGDLEMMRHNLGQAKLLALAECELIEPESAAILTISRAAIDLRRQIYKYSFEQQLKGEISLDAISECSRMLKDPRIRTT